MLSAHSLYALAKAIQTARLGEAEAARLVARAKKPRRGSEAAIFAPEAAFEAIEKPAHRKIA